MTSKKLVIETSVYEGTGTRGAISIMGLWVLMKKCKEKEPMFLSFSSLFFFLHGFKFDLTLCHSCCFLEECLSGTCLSFLCVNNASPRGYYSTLVWGGEFGVWSTCTLNGFDTH